MPDTSQQAFPEPLPLLSDYLVDEGMSGLTTEELLNDPGIGRSIEENQNLEENIRAAAKYLARKPDALPALRKSIKGLVRRKVQVFFSYKKKDEEAVKAIIRELKKYAGGRLEFTYMAGFQRVGVGEPWDDQIRTGIKNAHWFILLLPDPSDDWDWCLFETGMFRGSKLSCDRLFCLHHPDIEQPKQIREFQAVPTDKEHVKGFLSKIYVDTNPIPGMLPINPDILDDIPRIADEIVKAIRPPSLSLDYEILDRFVTLTIDPPSAWKDVSTPADLARATLVDTDPSMSTLQLFGFQRLPDTWGELVEDVAEENRDTRWQDELCTAISRAAQGRSFDPVQATFQEAAGRKFYRPVLHAVGHRGGQTAESFRILFIEDASAMDAQCVPRRIQVLATVLRSAFRFRWEVIEPYCKDSLAPEDLRGLADAMDRIETDARSRGLEDRGELLNLYQGSNNDQVLRMMADWSELHNQGKTGRLDLAIRDGDVVMVAEILHRLKSMNSTFLDITSQLFADQFGRQNGSRIGWTVSGQDQDGNFAERLVS